MIIAPLAEQLEKINMVFTEHSWNHRHILCVFILFEWTKSFVLLIWSWFSLELLFRSRGQAEEDFSGRSDQSDQTEAPPWPGDENLGFVALSQQCWRTHECVYIGSCTWGMYLDLSMARIVGYLSSVIVFFSVGKCHFLILIFGRWHSDTGRF